MFKLFSFLRPPEVNVLETWANHNAKKATPDDLIAGAVVASFAKDFKHWKFEGGFEQKRLHSSSYFKSTKLTRKVPPKKHVEIIFAFEQIIAEGLFHYKPIGCEVNGVAMTTAAFNYIFTNWVKMVEQVKKTEAAAAAAKLAMELNEKKWDIAEGLLGMKRDGLGRLMPVKSVEGEAQC